jgi:hypothetical protein
MPEWVWLLLGWVLLSVLVSAGLARWFQGMRDGERD